MPAVRHEHKTEGTIKKPNIVLITADQWRGDCLGCAGGRHPVMTPHLNQIAAAGVRFTQAYADCPVCMPQRVTLLTGQAASRFGLPHNFTQRSPVDRPASLPARRAREAGNETPDYYAANPYWSVVLEALAIDKSVPVTPVQSQIADLVTEAVDEVWFGVTTPQEALDWAHEQARPILDKFWSGA